MRLLISIPVLAAAAALSGCGGSDDSSTNTGIQVSTSLKGLSVEPELNAVNAEVVDGLTLNSEVSGFIADQDMVSFSYDATSSGLVIVSLVSAADDLDLTVRSGQGSVDSSNLDSNEMIVFDAVSGSNYSIIIDSYEGEGDYTLKVVRANRETLELSDNEYLASLNENEFGDCGSYTTSDSNDYFIVFNWTNGYLGKDDGKTKFTSSEENTIVIEYSESESEEDYSYSYEGTLTVTVDPDTGVISGTDIWSDVENDQGDITECSYETTLSGQVEL
jgi:hypothetical protein